MTIARTMFYLWLVSYAVFKEGVQPEEGRDTHGRWIVIKMDPKVDPQQKFI